MREPVSDCKLIAFDYRRPIGAGLMTANRTASPLFLFELGIVKGVLIFFTKGDFASDVLWLVSSMHIVAGFTVTALFLLVNVKGMQVQVVAHELSYSAGPFGQVANRILVTGETQGVSAVLIRQVKLAGKCFQ